jgi:pyruvate kinase
VSPACHDDWASLINELETIRDDMARLADESADILRDVHGEQRASARNLLHYLALRGRDLRPLQARLAAAGLSSLGRAESHALGAVNTLLRVLYRLEGRSISVADPIGDDLDLAEGQRLLDLHTEAALGPGPTGRDVAIMVTMPSEAAEDYSLVARLVEHGMDSVRINCAHDGPEQWARMIANVERAVEHHGRTCRLLMDLAGPTIRTASLETGPAVVKIKPKRDLNGRVTELARVWLFASEEPRTSPTPADASLPVPREWLRQLARGDRIRLTDARAASREWHVLAVEADGCWVESRKTCYVATGTSLRARPQAGGAEKESGLETQIGTLAAPELKLELIAGDTLMVTRSSVAGRNAVRDDHGHVLTPAMVGCTAEQIFADVRSGDRMLFDDGRIAGVVERCESDRVHVRITRTRARGGKLGAEKGMNLPDTVLHLAALTDKDRADLDFVCHHADLVALSFVNTVDDVRELRTLLQSKSGRQPAVVLKIETRRGFENLPSMLLEAMKSPSCAVMIARGDLAVECGFERMAEVQEEILWLCDAAHVPVIWATGNVPPPAK